MKRYIWELFVITAMAIFLGASPAVNAVEEDELKELSVSGRVKETYPDINLIVIDSNDNGAITISCFPFNKLEAELDDVLAPLTIDAEDIEIGVGDCVTVMYSEKILRYSGEIVNKFESLTEYCEDCNGDCYEGELNNEPMAEWHRIGPGCGQAEQAQEQVKEQEQEQGIEQGQELGQEQGQELGQEQSNPLSPPLGHDR